MTIILSRNDLLEPRRPIIGGKPSLSAFNSYLRDSFCMASNIWYQGDNGLVCLKARCQSTDRKIKTARTTIARILE